MRERDAPEGKPPIFAIGLESMEVVTVDELKAELSPWVLLGDGHHAYLEADRKIEFYKADREYRDEQALGREQPGLEKE